MKRKHRCLKSLLLAPFALTALVVGFALVLLQQPQLLFHPRLLPRLERLVRGAASGAGWELEWRAFRPTAWSIAFLEKRFDFEFEAFCARSRERAIEVCFESARLGATLGFAGFVPKLEEVGPIDLRGGRVSLRKSLEKKEKGGHRLSAIAGFLDETKIRGVRIEVKKLSVHLGDRQTLRGELAIRNDRRGLGGFGWRLESRRLSLGPRSGSFAAWVESPSRKGAGPWRASLHAQGRDDSSRFVAELGGELKGPLERREFAAVL